MATKSKKKTAKKSAKKAPKEPGARAARGAGAKGAGPAKKPGSARTCKEAMATLEGLGTPQNRKVYARHGVAGEQFGVSFGALRPLAKEIGVSHDMAAQLWATRNHDARMLATMIADPAQMRAGDLDAWVKDVDNYVLTDAFSGLAAHSAHALRCVEAWVNATSEFVCRCGYSIVGVMLRDGLALPAPLAQGLLARIEREIHSAPNRTREAMNWALIAIGAGMGELEDEAIAAAQRIGPVEVDHGETGCKTPDAPSYIKKAAAHRKKKAGGR